MRVCGGRASEPHHFAHYPRHVARYRCKTARPVRRLTPLAPPPYTLDRDLLEREVEIQAFRASGPGGQHVNRTESALRLVHPPSGVVVVAQDSPSQHRNREIAFQRLLKRLEALNHVPRKRIPTRPSRAAKVRRLEGKRQVATTKRLRGKVRGDE